MSQTGFINFNRAGQFAYNKPHRVSRVKMAGGSGAAFEVYFGAMLANDPAVTTPTDVTIAKANAVQPFYQALGPEYKKNTGITYPMGQNDVTILAKLDTQTSCKVLEMGETLAFFDGVVTPGQPAIAVDGTGGTILGHLKQGLKTDGTKIAGRFLGLPGRDGKYISAPTPNAIGTLGWLALYPSQ
jgi:hypothetical protein